MSKRVMVAAAAACCLAASGFFVGGQLDFVAWQLAKATIPNVDGGPHGMLCTGDARCLKGLVTKVVDGDTIDLGAERVRFAMIDTPEAGEDGYGGAKEFTAKLCPRGSDAVVDEDDAQTHGSHGRMVGVVHCNGHNLNAELLDGGHAVLLERHCATSEFSGTDWAKRHGC